MASQRVPIFQKYDFGEYKNMKVYGSKKPAEYDLENINIPVYLFVGNHDLLATTKNVNLLKYFLKKFFLYTYDLGHAGFLWDKNMDYLEDLVNVIEAD